ncbi:MAG: class I SAM-dependent methyltransferase [Defluviitaleaceae bacterium]|nr:class I SAM-dependent methyltransferase [Defluviitaleaceae bacterium]
MDNFSDGNFSENFKNHLFESITLKDNDSVLDIGCGNGTFLMRMAKLKNIVGYGIDISPKMIENAKELSPSFNFAVSDCENIPFSDNSMDIITVCAAHHHFPNIGAFAKEANRLIRGGGSIYIVDFYLPIPFGYFTNVFAPLSVEHDVQYYSIKELVNIFSSVGFRKVRKIKKGHIQIVSLKA